MIDVLDMRNLRWPEDEDEHYAFASELVRYDEETGAVFWRVNKGRARAGSQIGYADKKGYLFSEICQKIIKVHRLAWLLYYKEWPNGMIDHINGNPADNRIQNLRCVSHAENMKNCSLRIDNKSGVTGVSFDKWSNKWTVRIREGAGKKFLNIGRFRDFEDAVAARKEAEKMFGFHENHGRQRSFEGEKNKK